jgi:hypothetical protein
MLANSANGGAASRVSVTEPRLRAKSATLRHNWWKKIPLFVIFRHMQHSPDNTVESAPTDSPDTPDEAPLTLVEQELKPWEAQYARWMALQIGRLKPGVEMSVAQTLAGHNLKPTSLKRVKCKVAWRREYQLARAELNDIRLKAAHGYAIALLTSGMKVYRKAVDALDRELTPDPNTGQITDPLGAIRAAAPLLGPLLDRSLPKKTESSTIATSISITLTPEQMAGLDAPALQITAERIAVIPPPDSPEDV